MNGYSDTKRAQDFSVLRAAEIAQANGYPFFMVSNEYLRRSGPGYEVIIETKMFKERPSLSATVHETSIVLDDIRRRYSITPKI